MNNFTIPEADIRSAYTSAFIDYGRYSEADAGARFDRWLNQVKAEVWNECLNEVATQGTVQLPKNPYEK